jgi:hypothetical protein
MNGIHLFEDRKHRALPFIEKLAQSLASISWMLADNQQSQ